MDVEDLLVGVQASEVEGVVTIAVVLEAATIILLVEAIAEDTEDAREDTHHIETVRRAFHVSCFDLRECGKVI